MGREVRAFDDEALGNRSYLIPAGDGTALVVDPRRDAGAVLDAAAARRLRVTAVLETHLHADFVGGAREIAAATGATIYAARDAGLGFPHEPVDPGSMITAGYWTIEVMATPGHTPAHVAYLLRDGDASALFSGGSLIGGGAARTDLSGGERTDELARAQFASLRRIAELADQTRLYPTHGGGSYCSTSSSGAKASTIGEERKTNELFGITHEDEFVRRLTSGFGSYPRYFAHLAEVNRAGADLLASLPPVRALDGAAARDLVDGGAWLVDGRSPTRWAAEHAAGSIALRVRPEFASWLGWVVPFDAPFVLMLDDDRKLEQAVVLSRRIGYDHLLGWTTPRAWREAGGSVASAKALKPEDAAEQVERGALLLDVRQRSEWDEGHIPGAAHIELGDVAAGKTPESSRVVTYCSAGERSTTAASLLERRGIEVASIAGGVEAWKRSGLPYG